MRKIPRAISFSYSGPSAQFVKNQSKQTHRHLTVLLVHHVRAKTRLGEQAHQRGGTSTMERTVFDGSGQHLGRGVEVLRGNTGTCDSSRSIAT